jgi:hypothetical protein
VNILPVYTALVFAIVLGVYVAAVCLDRPSGIHYLPFGLAMVMLWLWGAATACAYQGSTAVFGGPLTVDDYSLIERAETEWCTRSEGRCCPAQLGLAYQSIEPRTCEAVGVATDCGGFFSERERLISLVVSLLADRRLRYVVILHEQGHACGLDHSDDMQALMYPVNTPYSHISQSDLEALQ